MKHKQPCNQPVEEYELTEATETITIATLLLLCLMLTITTCLTGCSQLLSGVISDTAQQSEPLRRTGCLLLYQ